VIYDERDLGGWIKSYFRWIRRGRRVFDEPPDPRTIDIPDDARIALFGDWASGRYGAPVIGDTLRRDPQPIHAAIHLGDTYYSGQESEVRRNLLGPWPFRDGMRSFALTATTRCTAAATGCGSRCSGSTSRTRTSRCRMRTSRSSVSTPPSTTAICSGASSTGSAMRSRRRGSAA